MSPIISQSLKMLAICVAAALLMALPKATLADIAIKSGQSIAFLGDSITQRGWNNAAGYVRLVVAGFDSVGIKVTAIPAGVSGNTSKNMLARIDHDVIAAKPDWLTISCGVNDVWHVNNGVALPDYKSNMTAMVDKAQAAGIKVMILTATPIGEDLGNANNAKLADYNAFLVDLAKQKGCLLADLNIFVREGLKSKPGTALFLTLDGVHMNPRGDFIMATGILQTFGLSDAQAEKATNAWLEIPGGGTIALKYKAAGSAPNVPGKPPHILNVAVPLTVKEWLALDDAAGTENMTEAEKARDLLAKDVAALIKPTGTFDSFDAIFDTGADSAVTAQLTTQLTAQIQAQAKSLLSK